MVKKPLRVLLVDDDPDDRQFFQEAVNEINTDIHCDFCRDGIEALEFLDKTGELPQFIFLDMNMPRMDGKECLKEIKRHPVFSGIPVIIYSTSRMQHEEDDFLRHGASRFLQKPSSFTGICHALSSILSPVPGNA
jgi:CheY-like chemotaxis protein